MLNVFRQGGVVKTLMGGVVLLIIGAFALDYRTSVTGSGDECVAEMDGTCIELAEYQTLLRLVAPPGATNKELREAGFVKYAVDALVERELLLREAKRLGVGVSEDDLDSVLSLGHVHFSWPADAPIPQALASGRPFPKTGATPTITYLRVNNSDTGGFDYDIYKRQVQSRLRMSPKAFKASQEAEVVAARVRELVTNPVRVSEDEVWSQYATAKSSATARVVEAKVEWFQRFVVQQTEADVDAFVAANAALVDESWAEEQKRWTADCPLVSELLFEYEPGADDTSKQKTLARAEQAKRLLEQKLDFESVARLTSDADNATAGGALGCLAADYGPQGADLVSAVEKVAKGATTDILETPKGRHVFLFHGKLSKEDAEKLGKRALARRLASERAARDRAKAFTAKLIELGKGGAELATVTTEQAQAAIFVPAEEEVAAVVRELALASESVPVMEVSRTFDRGGTPLFGVKGDFDAGAALFGLAKADELLSEPVETFTGFAALQLKEKTEATREDFEKEKGDLLRAARELRRAEVLTSYIARLRASIKTVKLNPKHTGQDEEDAPPAGSG